MLSLEAHQVAPAWKLARKFGEGHNIGSESILKKLFGAKPLIREVSGNSVGLENTNKKLWMNFSEIKLLCVNKITLLRTEYEEIKKTQENCKWKMVEEWTIIDQIRTLCATTEWRKKLLKNFRYEKSHNKGWPHFTEESKMEEIKTRRWKWAKIREQQLLSII